MKLLVLSPDATGKVDGTNKHTLLDRLPLTTSYAEADAVIVPISFFSDFVFDPANERIRKPVIIVDYFEYGWDFWLKPGRETHLFGDGALPEYLQSNPEWAKLDAWLAANPPALYFKRELLAENASKRVLPIEFLAMQAAGPVQTREQFDARPYDVMNVWGYSNPARPRLHGEIFKAMGDRGINVISDWSQFTNMPAQPSRTWASIYSPYWVRQPIGRVMDLQRQSKLSVSLPGAGQKCFRSSESPVDCIMALQEDALAWSFPWIDGWNCIRLTPGEEFEGLHAAARWDGLYDIYLHSLQTVAEYRPESYIPNYVLPAIREALR